MWNIMKMLCTGFGIFSRLKLHFLQEENEFHQNLEPGHSKTRQIFDNF